MRKFGFKIPSLIALSLLTALGAQANVSLRNGNFFVGYTDVFYPGGFEPKIERVYNSKTPYKGIFGWGWGNEYEAFLKVAADGCVTVHEYGGGAENRFCPAAFNTAELDKAIDTLAGLAKTAGALASNDAVNAYKKKLKTDPSFRNEEWEKFRTAGKIKPRQLPEGVELVSNKFSFQKVKKVAGGYIRTFDNGKSEKYSDAGRLTRIQDKNGNFLDLAYDNQGRIQRLSDNFNRRMTFTFDTKGFVSSIEGENGKKAEYKYNGNGELVYSKDVDGNFYTYKYDTAGRHNMIEIGYSDKTTMAMSYYGRDKQENIKTVKDRDGTVTEYGYLNSSADNYAVTVAVKGADGKAISTSKYEYFLKHKADGEEYQYKLITTIDGDRTETTYNECCGLPLVIKHGSEETTFQYDDKGHVTKKVTPTEVTELAYDKNVGKVTQVRRYSKTDKKSIAWSQFQYDTKGNLVFARNSESKGVKLFYDTQGRIKMMVDQGQRQISFKYNENSKPIEISDPKLGTITVSYTNSGEIKKVESSAGRRIALQVTSAFQNLLDIIRPAGVTLSF